MLAIANPQYAFLEADYTNPNLNQALWELEDSSEIVNQNVLIANSQSKAVFKIIPTSTYLKVSAVYPYLIAIPVDIYCIVILLIGEFLY